ncbi:hypothetical protein ABZ504_52555 [Streptomyces mirabilis]|uniref:hypothetical protein n=1 Tax=Streptomyces mirabilis TaxID=68239 RepID=UPI0033F60BE7
MQDWIGVLLLDNGYCTTENLTAPGPDRLIASGNSRDLPRLGKTWVCCRRTQTPSPA